MILKEDESSLINNHVQTFLANLKDSGRTDEEIQELLSLLDGQHGITYRHFLKHEFATIKMIFENTSVSYATAHRGVKKLLEMNLIDRVGQIPSQGRGGPPSVLWGLKLSVLTVVDQRGGSVS